MKSNDVVFPCGTVYYLEHVKTTGNHEESKTIKQTNETREQRNKSLSPIKKSVLNKALVLCLRIDVKQLN